MSTLRLMAIDAICQRGSVRDSDVATLRRAFALENQIAATDIDALFRAHSLARVQAPAWSDFFIETLTDYVVRELEPSGYVTAAHAGWLIARLSSAGRVRTKTEHSLLLNVIDKARWVPESLLVFALAQIRDAVTTGEGPLRATGDPGPGRITLTEVDQIRALMFAYGNEGPVAVTQVEAELLLDIERALATAPKADRIEEATASPLDAWPIESWRDLLQKALASAVLGASGYAGPTREEALNEAVSLTTDQQESPLSRGDAGIAQLATHSAPRANSILSGYRPLGVEARALQRLELQRIEIITGEPVSPADGSRLAALVMTHALQAGTAATIADTLTRAGFCLHPAFGHAHRDATASAA